MGAILQKKQMSEEDIKLQYITPSILSKWSREKITMETRITDGKVNLKGNFVFREKPKRADYILYLSANNPIAIVEAKDNLYSLKEGIEDGFFVPWLAAGHDLCTNAGRAVCIQLQWRRFCGA